jgi:transglycosylase-like protein with SLT domain
MSAAAFERSRARAALCAAVLAIPALARGDATDHRGEGPVPPAAISAGAGPVERAAGWVHARMVARLRRLDDRARAHVAGAVLAEAKLTGVDPLLVIALIDVESSFDPDAVSEAGAIGLMQLRQATLRSEAERSGLPSVDPFDPVTNVRAGVRYLRRLIDAFGDVDLALMAYNAGPSRIVSHLRRGAIPDRFQAYPRNVNAELVRLRASLARHAAWSSQWTSCQLRLACHAVARRPAGACPLSAPPGAALAAGMPREVPSLPAEDAVPAAELARVRARARTSRRRVRAPRPAARA